MALHRSFVLVTAVLVVLTLASCVSQPNGGPSSSAATTSPSPTGSTSAPSPSTTSHAPTSTPTSPPNPAPGQVVGLTTHVGGGSGEVLVTWTQSSESDVVSYIVYRALAPGGSVTRIGTMSRHDVTLFPDLPFVDINATVGYYRVRAVDSAGQRGPLSAEVCGAAPGHSC